MARQKVIDSSKRSQILRLRAEGKSVRAIAAEVGVSTGTVSAVINSPTPELDDIDDIDRRLQEIREAEEKLKAETEDLQKQRFDKFVGLDGTITYEVDLDQVLKECRIYIMIDGRKQVLYEGSIYKDDPNEYTMKAVPQKYKKDFITVWHKAKEEYDYLNRIKEERWRQAFEDTQKTTEEYAKIFQKMQEIVKNSDLSGISEENKRKIIRTLLKIFHPDAFGQKVTIANDDPDIIKDILQLKNAWGV